MTPGQFQKSVGIHDLDTAVKWYHPLINAMTKAEINTPLRQAHFLSQIAHESGSLRWLREIAPQGEDAVTHFEKKYGFRTSKGKRLGNTEPGDGGKYFGRGPLQCTGRDNYKRFGDWLPLNCLVLPDLLLEPHNGAQFCAWYWIVRDINPLADADNIEGVTRKINGGLTHIVDRALRLNAAKKALGIAA
jgi:putative chitinase